jgi:hypothetical protein
MISTITTSTVTILTSSAFAGTLALVGIFVLISLLVQKELTTNSTNSRLIRLGRVVNIGILPLLIAFILVVIFRVIEIIN